MIAAMAMRKLQALHLIATPGVLTTTDVLWQLSMILIGLFSKLQACS